jgi:hypothetical protein
MRSVSEMSKTELQTARAERIVALASARVPARRLEIQADLSNINARLKQLNIAESTQLKDTADVRKAAGYAENDQNLRRAIAKMPVPVPAPTAPTPIAKTHSKARANGNSGSTLTRGEYLFKHAKQMLKAIDTIKPERQLPHTKAFRLHLEAFIAEQRGHLTEQRHLDELAKLTPTTPNETDWKHTWTETTEKA